jgi:hypothetical protein
MKLALRSPELLELVLVVIHQPGTRTKEHTHVFRFNVFHDFWCHRGVTGHTRRSRCYACYGTRVCDSRADLNGSYSMAKFSDSRGVVLKIESVFSLLPITCLINTALHGPKNACI